MGTDRGHQTFHTNYASKQNQFSVTPMVEQAAVKQLQIIGLELGPKRSLFNTNDYQSMLKNAHSGSDRRIKLARVDQSVLQLPRRTAFTYNRRVPEHTLSRYVVY